jgi:HEAT repeat protein
MNDHRAPYVEIMLLLRQWDNGLQQEDTSPLMQLRQYEAEEISSALSAILSHAEDDMRLIAVDAAPHLVPREVMIDLLVPGLSDARSSVRWSICKVFQKYPDPRVIERVLSVLQNDGNPHVRVAAVDVLCEVGDARSLPVLAYAMEHDWEKNYEGRTVAQAAEEAIAAIQKRLNAA